ncbi:MAG: lysophospholipid acyltransferase family protein [Lysobacterales bacterium]
MMAEREDPVTKHGDKFVWRKQLDRVWRFFATVLGFFLFGLGGLVIGLVIFPLIFVFVRNPETRQILARRLLSGAFKLFLFIFESLGGLSYEIKGAENVIAGNNQIIIANHPTLIDVIFLVSLFPMADCVIKEAITRNPFMRSVVLSANYIPSGNTGKLLVTCVKRLKSGASLLLFPEGTRSVPGQRLDFKLGAASFAVKAGADILPVTIQCTQPRFLVKDEPWYRVPPERPFFSIQVYPSQPLDTLIPEGLHPRQATRELNKAFLDFFESKLS